ncbi:MAG: bifunctional phosphoribosyl-AMP cyclohydrolase/phosphoribosyl-ATP diphosphatase HisIE [Lachnospiraceae bacterium]|nr:bifunctional phosphoribosyl-AMP cyclohydrolase/phosphoribosyl-ATP diphosphatase HisIE [Lachnospiraceae bacterium]
MVKNLIPSIFLKDEKAVAGFKDTRIIDDDPVSYAKKMNRLGGDMLLIFDLSASDKEHEKNLDIIREISRSTDIPLIGAGNIKRSEDVKKLKYAGCSHVALNLLKQSNVELMGEVSKRFSKDCIFVCADVDAQILDNVDSIREYCSGVIYLGNELEGEYKGLNIYCLLDSFDQREPVKTLKKLLLNPSVAGVCGEIINSNLNEIQKYKVELKEMGIDTNIFKAKYCFSDFKKGADGLVPVVVCDHLTDQVLMVAYMNEEAYDMTIKSSIMTYYSRSRQKLWIKGEESGHYQYLKEMYGDCDMDTILVKVKQVGAACHTGSYSCFFNEVLKKDYDSQNPMKVFEDVFDIIKDRRENPKEGSYTNYLFEKGMDKILKKVGEEATEIVIAAKNPDKEEVKYEMADFLYHMMVLMAECNLEWSDITTELKNR